MKKVNIVSTDKRDNAYLERKRVLSMNCVTETPTRKIISTIDESNTVGFFLCSNDISIELFNDSDFLKLSCASMEMFDFLKAKHVKNIFQKISSEKMGRFFVFLCENYFSIWDNLPKTVTGRFDDVHNQKARDFQEWLKKSKLERRKIFFSLLKNIKNHPDTPIEILVELL